MRSALSERSAMTMHDVNEFYRKGLSEAALHFARSEKEKTQTLMQYRDQFVPQFIRQAEDAGQKALASIDEAERNKWIAPVSAAKWRARLKEGTWLEKRAFIENTLPEYKQNWERLAKDHKDVLNREKGLGLKEEDTKDIPDLAVLHSAAFLNGSLNYSERRHLVDKAIACVKAHERDKGKKPTESKEMRTLFGDAKAMLEKAASASNPKLRILAPEKVGSWLRRIFESNASRENIAHFINGRDNATEPTLAKLMKNWAKVRGQFDRVEREREKKGTPASFHFVSLDVFLGNRNFDQREAYVQEALHRLEAMDMIGGEREDFLRIRHELDAEDWEGAHALIAQVSWQSLNPTDRKKLSSMQEYLKQHRPETAMSSSEKPAAKEVMAKMHQMLRLIPHQSIRVRFEEAMSRDYQTLWALCTMNYNWEWCRTRGYSSDSVDETMRTRAKEDTRLHLKHGQPRGQANNDFTTDTSEKPAGRSANDTRSPQVLNVDETTNNYNLVEYIKQNKDNRSVWYWTRIVEKQIPFADLQFIIHHIQPALKSGMRRLKELDVPYQRMSASVPLTSVPKSTTKPVSKASSKAA